MPPRALLSEAPKITVRPVRPGDEGALCEFLQGLCPEARRMRFFTPGASVERAARWAAESRPDQYGLLGYDENGVLVAHAAYVQLDPERAEVAVEVADRLHGHGLGTTLIEQLAMVAEQRGITHFVAEVLRENRAMLDVFRDGFDAHVALHGSTNTVEFPTAAWRLAYERFKAGAAGAAAIADARA